MPIWRLQTEFSADSTLPRDVLTITPHFDDGGALTDPQGLCDDLAAALDTWVGTGERQIKVTAYDAQGTKPVYPQGEAIVNVGVAPASACMREVALCLSFYSQRNIPRQRGRLYIPAPLWTVASGLTVRPSGPQRQQVMGLGPIFEQLGGVDVDWVVYSRADNDAYPVTNYWVDDEWDVVRSRGLRSTTREEASTSEA